MYKKLIGVTLAISLLCGSVFAATIQQRLARARITPDTLPSDGCQHTAVIGQNTYAFDASSYSLLAKAYEKIAYGKDVRQKIRYTITGNTGTVACGWGTSKTYPEIHIDFFVPKSVK